MRSNFVCTTTGTETTHGNSKGGKMSTYLNRRAIVSALHNVLETNLSEVEQPAKSETLPIVKPQDKPPSRPLDQWSQNVMRNMKRMATDEDYRKSIAQKLS